MQQTKYNYKYKVLHTLYTLLWWLGKKSSQTKTKLKKSITIEYPEENREKNTVSTITWAHNCIFDY